ncbi:hypothetical protein CPAR01_09908 [Colletotrichum paranaense]|uniref:Uncharacterized protein n=1 Tax=Colletotrichum paranaense TaxID=1914294 RepID=A0ABQ9SCL1_9PEZI|nr:uncharacterized protein CPAR01_09908 [Colletotrichum paranaense]KAK1533200.1 hypothetical protein CPAR01_09908 [Colletotrichum paranaense]
MSGLEALGVAGNIFQVISFGRDTASLIKQVYRDATVDDTLEVNAKELAQLAAHIQALEGPQLPTKQEDQLLEIAKKVPSLAPKANWRKRGLNNLERKLNDAQRLMQSGLLARICQKTDAMHLDLKSLRQQSTRLDQTSGTQTRNTLLISQR